jgi:protease-4
MHESQPPDASGTDPQPAMARVRAEHPPAAGWERETVEKLMFATLREQRISRRWRTFFRLSWLALVVFIIWALMYRGGPSADKSLPHTAVIEIKGEIASGGDASAETVVAAMRSAFEDSGAKAVVLLIDSPGGSPVQAGIIYDEIRRL